MKYSTEQRQQLVNTICQEIAKGKSARSVLSMEGMPDDNTFWRWVDNNEEIREQYARAMDARAAVIFEEILTIGDDKSEDKYIDQDGKLVQNTAAIQRDRLRVDARKWMLSKMNPKKYGDKTDLNITGNLKVEGVILE